MRIDRVRLAAAMARADMNGNELTDKSGLSRGTVTSVRSGKSCSKETAEKLAAALGLSLAELIAKEE